MLLIFTACLSVGCKKSQKSAEVNLVLQVEFLDTETPFSANDGQILKSAFCGKENSLDNFIKTNSNGNHLLESKLLGVVKIKKSIDYFMPRYEYDYDQQDYKEINADGYDNRLFDENGNPSTHGKQSAERFYREQELVYLASANAQDLVKGLGKKFEFENLTIVTSKLNRYVSRDDLFHPHQARYYTGDVSTVAATYHAGGTSYTIKEAKLGNKSINSYILLPYAYLYDGNKTTTTTLCHEYMHVLGAPDLYSYDVEGKRQVGEFDVLGGESTPYPTHSLAYVKCKLGWLREGEDILPITHSGEYVLPAVEDGKGVKAYKITLASYYENGDVFYLEHRKLGNASLGQNRTEGVIIYRVNEENGYISKTGEKTNVWRGNAYGDTEITVFRNVGDLILGPNATLTDRVGYTVYGSEGNDVNTIFCSDGENSQIVVTYLEKTENGDVKIKVDIPEKQIVIPAEKVGLVQETGLRRSLYFDRADEDYTAYVYYTTRRIKNPTPKKILKDKKGELFKLNTLFLKARLPSDDGYEKYVYVFYEDENGYSSVFEYKIQGVKNIKVSTIILIGVGVGLLPTVLLTVVKKIKAKRRKNV